MSKVDSNLPADEGTTNFSLVGLVASWLLACLLFVPTWAGFNFAFGSALDGPIGGFLMETPCQRLAGTTEPLSRYTLAGGKSLHSSSVCHFASRPVSVDGPTDGLGFKGRELAYLVVGFAGYGACFAGALTLTFIVVRGGRRLVSASNRSATADLPTNLQARPRPRPRPRRAT